jgi:hypothetical protein
MTVRYEFKRDAGYRFFKDGVSILLHALAIAKEGAILTNTDCYHFLRRINKYLQSVGGYSLEKLDFGKILTIKDFADLEDLAFYKFGSKQWLDYILKDSFQFGSIDYYRNIEEQNSKDTMEGLSNLVISTPKRIICTSLVSGYNYCIFCGTSRLDNRDQMSNRFGPKIVKIADLRKFAEEVKAILGARRFFLHQVIYDDLKIFRVKTLKSFNGRTRNFDPQVISDSIFDLLYDSSFLPSLYIKPTRFSVEQELRLVFEMPNDVPHKSQITDRGLLRHIEIVS